MCSNWIYRRGDVYLANLNPFTGSEQGGTRPVVTVSNDVGNYFSSMVTVLPITSQLKKPDQPTHVMIDNVRGLSKPSMVCAEQPKSISKIRIKKYLGRISREKMEEIDEAVLTHFGIEIPECVDAP